MTTTKYPIPAVQPRQKTKIVEEPCKRCKAQRRGQPAVCRFCNGTKVFKREVPVDPS